MRCRNHASFTFLTICLLVEASPLFGRQLGDSLIVVSPRCGARIDSFEVAYYGLFGMENRFVYASFVRDRFGAFVYVRKYQNADSVWEGRTPVTKTQLDRIARSIDYAEFVGTEEWLKGKPMTDYPDDGDGATVSVCTTDGTEVEADVEFADIYGIVLRASDRQVVEPWESVRQVRILRPFGTSTWGMTPIGAAIGVGLSMLTMRNQRGGGGMFLSLFLSGTAAVVGFLVDLVYAIAGEELLSCETVGDRVQSAKRLQVLARYSRGTEELKARLSQCDRSK